MRQFFQVHLFFLGPDISVSGPKNPNGYSYPRTLPCPSSIHHIHMRNHSVSGCALRSVTGEPFRGGVELGRCVPASSSRKPELVSTAALVYRPAAPRPGVVSRKAAGAAHRRSSPHRRILINVLSRHPAAFSILGLGSNTAFADRHESDNSDELRRSQTFRQRSK